MAIVIMICALGALVFPLRLRAQQRATALSSGWARVRGGSIAPAAGHATKVPSAPGVLRCPRRKSRGRVGMYAPGPRIGCALVKGR